MDIREGHAEDTSTWLGLGVVASHLNSACSNHYDGKRYKGGWTSAGNNERVKITLRFANVPGSATAAAENNRTLEAEEAFL